MLLNKGYDKSERDPWWWPNSGSFEVVVGAVLTQNSSWERVEKSLNSLRRNALLSPEKFALLEESDLYDMIRPSGFFKNKSKYLIRFSRDMLSEFGDFQLFKRDCTREWLLGRHGIGFETADSILNYACYKEFFVVDSYTARLLLEFGYYFESYNELQEWMLNGLKAKCKKLFPGLNSPAQIYARSHGMIVEYCKTHRKKGKISIEELIK